MASAIPIRNIYYLLCYAWNRLEEGAIVDVSGIDTTELADLFASVLINGAHHLFRRGLEQGYHLKEEELASVRGRVQVAQSARRMLIAHGKALCLYDDLNSDTIPNRILKGAMGVLARVPSLNDKLRHALLVLRRDMHEVSDVRLNRLVFRRVQLHGNNRFYRFLLSVCELIATSCLIDERTGEYRFRDFIRDEKRMAKLFENFVLNFYRVERPDLDVRRERIQWYATSTDAQALKYLPGMETDISIRSAECTLIIDTKFYHDLLVTRHDTDRFRSAHLNQIFAYVKNLEHRGGADARARGMLLYPVVEKEISHRFEMHGHEFSVCTVDLRKDWRELKRDMLTLLQSALSVRHPICNSC